MDRRPAQSLGQLLGYLTTELDQYYSNRLLDVSASRRSDAHLYFKTSKAFEKGKLIPKDSFTAIDDNTYHCLSQSTPILQYIIDMQAQTCSCEQGLVGKVCKHLIACSKTYDIKLFSLPPTTANSKQRLAVVAHGSCEQLSFYESLCENTALETDELYVDENGIREEFQSTTNEGCSDDEEILPASSGLDLNTGNDNISCSAPMKEQLKRVQTATLLANKMHEKLLSVIKNDVSETFIKVLSLVKKIR